MFNLQTLWLSLLICIAVILYAASERYWNLLTIAIVLAFCSGLAIYFKLLSGMSIL